tara:strand:- start:280 stop:657 length:378 start_codon:yes stop_codon:yes gene_type:complete
MLMYLLKVEVPSIESTVGNLLADFEHIHNAVIDTCMSGTAMEIDNSTPGYTGVTGYDKWSGKNLWDEWSSYRVPLTMYHLLSLGSSLLTLSHTNDMDMDAWKMVMGRIQKGGRPSLRWNQVERNT